jgi:hypothetical protein
LICVDLFYFDVLLFCSISSENAKSVLSSTNHGIFFSSYALSRIQLMAWDGLIIPFDVYTEFDYFPTAYLFKFWVANGKCRGERGGRSAFGGVVYVIVRMQNTNEE